MKRLVFIWLWHLRVVYVWDYRSEESLWNVANSLLAHISAGPGGWCNTLHAWGTPAYWDKRHNDLTAMVRQLGKPTFSLTCSAAEMSWPEVTEVIEAQNGEKVDLSELDWAAKMWHCTKQPSHCDAQVRVVVLMTNLIPSPPQPISEVEDYFYQVEFQARGSLHLLLWVKDSPEFGSDLKHHVYKFIGQYITCQMLYPNADHELRKIVSEVQVYSRNPSKSCKKGNLLCRSGFPKLPMDKTHHHLSAPRWWQWWWWW